MGRRKEVQGMTMLLKYYAGKIRSRLMAASVPDKIPVKNRKARRTAGRERTGPVS